LFNSEYKLCAVDLDETLLGPDHEISARNESAVRRLATLGVNVVIASGRMHESTLRYAKQLDLHGPIVSYNGAVVKEPDTGIEWLHHKVPVECAEEILAYCEDQALQLNFYYDGFVHSDANTEWLQLYCGRTGSPYKIQHGLRSAMRGIAPTKLLIVNTPELTSGLAPYFKKRFEGVLYVTKSTDEYLEFMPAAASKGKALELVADRLGCVAAETIAIGDSYNDIPMITWAGLGIAVANARPDVIKVADRVAERADEDGVARILEDIYGLQ